MSKVLNLHDSMKIGMIALLGKLLIDRKKSLVLLGRVHPMSLVFDSLLIISFALVI